ncbi:MAG: hypothetical protein JO343_01490 [Candidatus Eremiobacteraeota bacterium]|nr:hypothetical protein [Candidatus Eremiobacteraeota bacterium]
MRITSLAILFLALVAASVSAAAAAPVQYDPQLLALMKQASMPYAGSTWSIFNHRGSGVFILLWGLTALIVGLQYPRRTWFRFVPPLMLLALAEFLILRNDPMTWPLGPIGFWYSMQSPEVFQHRIFILIIVSMGVIELLRAADRLPTVAARYAFPAVTLAGALLILFHQHLGPGMEQAMAAQGMPGMTMGGHDPNETMEASMAHIKHEHMWFAISGFCLVAAKLLADTGRLPGRLGAMLWPLFAIATGAYMLGYTE